jgi:hypothetical protein
MRKLNKIAELSQREIDAVAAAGGNEANTGVRGVKGNEANTGVRGVDNEANTGVRG